MTDFCIFEITVADYNDEDGYIYKTGDKKGGVNLLDNGPHPFGLDFANDDYGISFVDRDGTTRYYKVEYNPVDSSYYLAPLNVEK